MASVLIELSFLSLLMATSLAINWPLMKCSRSDPNVNQCLASAAQRAVPVITRGFPEIGVRQLEPMNMGEMKIKVNKSPVRLDIDLTNTYARGTSRIQINSAKYLNDVISVEGFHKELKLTGNYRLSGRLFLIPVSSEGYVEIRLKDLRSTHTVDFHKYPGTQVGFKINDMTAMTFTLNSPQGGIATRTLSKLLNNNWEVLLKAFKPEVEREIQRVYTEALSPLFVKFHPSIFFP